MRTPRWLDEEEQRAWRAFIDGSQRLMAVLNRDLQDNCDLTVADYRILVLLSEAADGSLRMSELAEGVLSSRSKLTHQVRRMESEGLVVRSTCAEDGRGVLATITEHGARRLRTAAPLHVESVRENFVDQLTRRQLKMLGEIFESVDARLARRGY